MKITDQKFYEYIDGMLTNDEKRQFEDYLQNNNDAQRKLKEFRSIDKKIEKSFSDPNINEFRVPEDLSNDYNELLQNIDHYKKNSSENLVQKKANDIKESKESFFKRNLSWLFPAQSFALAGLLAYVLLPFNISNQVANNQSANDFIMQADYVLQGFIPNSQFGDSKAVKINNQSFNIRDITNRDITKNLKTRSGVSPTESTNLSCDKNLDNKIIEIFQSDEDFRGTVTYCGILGKNNWYVKNIKLPKDTPKDIMLNSNYKLLFKDDSVYLLPQDQNK